MALRLIAGTGANAFRLQSSKPNVDVYQVMGLRGVLRMRSFKLGRKAGWLSCLAAIAIVTSSLTDFAQTKISYHPNKYKTSDDVRLGRQAAAEAERQFP